MEIGSQQANGVPFNEDALGSSKQWHTPSLTSFGSVQELTAGGSNFSPESGPGAPPPGSQAYQFYHR